MKKKLSHFKKMSKKIIPSKTRSKLKKIKDKEDKLSLYEHSIKSNLEMTIYNLEKKIKKIKDRDKKFHLSTKINLLNQRVKYFLIDHDKKDRRHILKQIKLIKKEL